MSVTLLDTFLFLWVVIDFVNLATTLYKNLASRKTADATLHNHIRIFARYQDHIAPITRDIFESKAYFHDYLIFQATWVLHLDDSLRQWLFDAGFRPTQQKAGVYLVRERTRAVSGWYTVEKRAAKPGPLKIPWFGVTEKETQFDLLFQKLKDAFDRLQTMYCDDHYRKTPEASHI
ncbi:hypothetical protein LTR97_006495 [Elasticomyces elasticus]|uniref:Uncharacterized protein n=1 Tax=Elasticomyces elasticus TaxID=574655 RepID=A0AAN8A2K8_9PEZI|nr:hypothetical protein LTR97_006495 [Elasticomyces elasticus]